MVCAFGAYIRGGGAYIQGGLIFRGGLIVRGLRYAVNVHHQKYSIMKKILSVGFAGFTHSQVGWPLTHGLPPPRKKCRIKHRMVFILTVSLPTLLFTFRSSRKNSVPNADRAINTMSTVDLCSRPVNKHTEFSSVLKVLKLAEVQKHTN